MLRARIAQTTVGMAQLCESAKNSPESECHASSTSGSVLRALTIEPVASYHPEPDIFWTCYKHQPADKRRAPIHRLLYSLLVRTETGNPDIKPNSSESLRPEASDTLAAQFLRLWQSSANY